MEPASVAVAVFCQTVVISVCEVWVPSTDQPAGAVCDVTLALEAKSSSSSPDCTVAGMVRFGAIWFWLTPAVARKATLDGATTVGLTATLAVAVESASSVTVTVAVTGPGLA